MVRLAPGQGKAKEQTELSTRSMLGLREKIHTLPPEGNSAMALHIDTREEPNCSRRGSIKPSTDGTLPTYGSRKRQLVLFVIEQIMCQVTTNARSFDEKISEVDGQEVAGVSSQRIKPILLCREGRSRLIYHLLPLNVIQSMDTTLRTASLNHKRLMAHLHLLEDLHCISDR